MASFSPTDEPGTRPDDWDEAPSESGSSTLSEPETVPPPRLTRFRDELWQPRYAVLAGIILLLIILQVWILF